MMDSDIDVPEYFMCPISLQIMKDPVTAITGITYDRESIEHWLFHNHNTICPVTKQPLPRNSDLTPNHTLRRLIQAWCTINGVDRISTPTQPLSQFYIVNLIRDLSLPDLQLKTLQKLENLATESDRNRVYMVDAGLAKALLSFVILCYKNRETNGLKEALSILYITRGALGQSRGALIENDEIIESLMWVLSIDCPSDKITQSHAAYALECVILKADPGTLDKLKPDFFNQVLTILRNNTKIPRESTNALLSVLQESCPWGRNRVAMVEAGAVFDLVELELMRGPDKKTTERVLGILYHLCSCADGRAQLLSHAAGIAVVTRRILKVSPAADERAVLIIWLISKYSGTNHGVMQEMLKVGTVAKLCMVMQANCGAHVKVKAREVLRAHSDVWKDSPCVEVATLTRCVT